MVNLFKNKIKIKNVGRNKVFNDTRKSWWEKFLPHDDRMSFILIHHTRQVGTKKNSTHVMIPLIEPPEKGWVIILTRGSLICLYILWCLERIISPTAAGCQSEKTMQMSNCETLSCKAKRIITAITETIAIITMPTVRCQELLGIKLPIKRWYLYWPTCTNCFL